MSTVSTVERKRVLVIEDEPASLGLTVPHIEGRGFGVETAATQAEAERLLGERRYHALLLDLKIPKTRLGEAKTDPPLPENGLAIVNAWRSGSFDPGGRKRRVLVFVFPPRAQESNFGKEARAGGGSRVFGKPV